MKVNKKILSGILLAALVLVMASVAFSYIGAVQISPSQTQIEQACKIPICRDGSKPFDTGKIDANGCKVYSCPPQGCSVPICDGGKLVDTGKTDYSGCEIYLCEIHACLVPACKDGSKPFDTGKTDANGCVIYSCQEVGCVIPICREGSSLFDTGKVDDNGCKIYSCTPIACLVPECPGGKLVDTGKTDYSGCKIYECQNQACSAPVCKDGSRPFDTGRVDANGCKVYSCQEAACTVPVCDGGKLVDTGKTDYSGCEIYQCLSQACSAPVCKDGSKPFDTGKVDENGCKVYMCKGLLCTQVKCMGSYTTGEYDDNGCPVYKCPPTVCPLIMCPEKKCEYGYEVDASGCLTCNCKPQPICPAITCSVSECKYGCEVDASGCLTGKCRIEPVECPRYEPPAPDWCKDGKIIPGTVDKIGCQGPPRCVYPTTVGTSVEVEIATPTGLVSISVEKVAEDKVSIKEGTASAETSKKLIIEEKKLYMETAKGNKEVKIMPSTASQTAIDQLKLKYISVELKDVGKPVYEITGTKDVKVIGLIRAEMAVKSQVDAETGALENTKKPWWSFLATEAAAE